jgi:hypothetical protein
MVDCSDFLERYSSYRDGDLDEEDRGGFEAHMRVCASCARYDRVIREGVRLYLDVPELTPSEDFLPRLQHRLYHVDEEMHGPGRTGSGASALLTLGIAVLIATAAWVPALRPKPALLQLPPIAARAPLPPEPLPWIFFERGPLLVRQSPGSSFWGSNVGASRPSDLFFQYSPAGAPYQVQAVSHR